MTVRFDTVRDDSGVVHHHLAPRTGSLDTGPRVSIQSSLLELLAPARLRLTP